MHIMNGYLFVVARGLLVAVLSWALAQVVVIMGLNMLLRGDLPNPAAEIILGLGVTILLAVGVSAWICARTNRLLGRKKAVASAAASLVGIAVVVRLLWLSFYWLFWGGIQKDPVLQVEHHGSNAFENGSPIHSKQQ
jgi:hypothetical protein